MATGIAFAVLLRTIHGAFHAASSNAASTCGGRHCAAQPHGRGAGHVWTVMAVSTAVAPAMGLYVMGRFGFRPLFAIATTAAVLAPLIGFSISDRKDKLSAAAENKPAVEKDSVPASITQFFFMMAYGVIEVYVGHLCTRQPAAQRWHLLYRHRHCHGAHPYSHGQGDRPTGRGILVYTGNAAIIVGILLLVFMHNTPCYLARPCCWLQFRGHTAIAADHVDAHSGTRPAGWRRQLHLLLRFRFRHCYRRISGGYAGQHFGYNVMFICISFSRASAPGLLPLCLDAITARQ